MHAGAKLVDYNVDTGVWVFDTFHWSRYAMDDSDDDEEGVGEKKGADGAGKPASSSLMPPPPPGRVRRVHGQAPSSGGKK